MPVNGRVALNAGDIVRVNGGEFLTLAGVEIGAILESTQPLGLCVTHA